MSDTEPLSPFDAEPIDTEPIGDRRSRRNRRRLIAGGVGLGVAAVAGTGYLILANPEDPDTGPMVITTPGTVLANQTIIRPIEIAANNVTLRRIVVKSGGTAVVTVRAGSTGTLIEDSKVYCTGRGTNGIAPGNYSAVRVQVFNCGTPFVYSPSAPASIVDSQHDGDPYPDVTPSPGPSPSSPTPGGPPTPLSYWPGPTTTGVPAGTILRDSGSLSLRQDGEVVSNLNITGCVNVYAKNVTIRKSRITCDSPAYALRTLGDASMVVEDVEINGTNKTAAAVCCANYTLRRVNIYNVNDGPRLGDNTNVIDSWIHDLNRIEGSHNDTLQTTAGVNIVVRHNRLDAYRASTRDPMNACLMIGSTTGPAVRNLLFEGNYCNGGNYSIGIRNDLTASNIVIRDNKFGRDYRYGVVARPNHPGITWDRSTNAWFDNGRPIPVD
ncbi:hypothetical protein GCM10027280_25340 [Micromonospora polyrhachis]|uniref:Right handed beta helix region n=1 Tax=Micromonospora polyrhachis TaxID=1282883 RepID=A0A7W7ST14_9ACTN|nr:hypothetical protein [Micromonospora polyrhachis]MBB4960374.1 hypothetical protein [Micromonospora polyrhachis]